MKYRNRGKHSFKRIKRQTQVYEYVYNKLKNKEEVGNLSQLSKELNIPITTLRELLNELNEQGKLIYRKGYIKIKGVGSNIPSEEGLVVKKVSKIYKSRVEKKNRVYNYLVALVNNGKAIPNLTEMHKEVLSEVHISTLWEILKELDKEEKIIYRKGRVLAVNVPNVMANREKQLKYSPKEDIKVEEIKEEVKEEPVVSDVQLDLIEKYDKAVKDLIAEYIINANISTKEEIIEYVNTLMNITDKLKNKLF